MKCKTCELEFIPPRKNVLNCSKCIIFKKAKNNQKEQVLKMNQKVKQIKIVMKTMKVMNK